ncbi:hypothetical protein FSP39_008900 [Pinctada imbricata]|uniref:BTB domain-containing protein n=1 Tax=Pinctada imbricata TaxID=66713 RepID=A0AA88Y1W2_PINIB|nr:hypothetical protein FSP39_008900 [Pinctada imbricata]
MAESSGQSWQNGRSISECLEYMWTNEIACDVTFVVGKSRVEMHAHKTILIGRSPVFQSIFDGYIPEKGTIAIQDIGERPFKLFLRYLYTDEVSFPDDCVLPLLYTAKKYNVDSLADVCREILIRKLNGSNACAVLEKISTVSDEKGLKKICINAIDHTTPHSEFSKLSRSSVQHILETEHLSLPEETIYELVMSWTDEQCRLTGLAIHDLNRRKVLEDMTGKIRFPVMDCKYFAENVASRDILTDREKVIIFQSLSTGKDQCSPDFIHRRRRSRFKKRETLDYTDINLNTCLPLSFKTSSTLLLHGVTIPSDSSTRFRQANLALNAHLTLLKKNQILCICPVLPSSYSSHEYLLDPPLHLLPQQSYSVRLNIIKDDDDDSKLKTTKSSATFVKFTDPLVQGSCKIAGLVVSETNNGTTQTENPKLERALSSNSAFY